MGIGDRILASTAGLASASRDEPSRADDIGPGGIAKTAKLAEGVSLATAGIQVLGGNQAQFIVTVDLIFEVVFRSRCARQSKTRTALSPP